MRLQMLSFEECLEKVKLPPQVKKNEYLDQGKYPVVSQESSLVSGYYNDVSKVFKIEKPIIIFGDHTQVLKYIDFDFIIGADGTKILQPIEKLNSKYFYYYLTLNMPTSTGYARHYKLLKKLYIPLPPLSEQKRIVDKLDKAFAEIDEALTILHSQENQILLLKSALFSKLLNEETMDWKIKKLGEICEVITKGTTPTSVGFNFENDGINFIKVESINLDGNFIPVKFAKVNAECHTALKRSQLHEGDILFSIAGALGRTAIVTKEIIPANTNQALAILRLKLDVDLDKKFLLYFLNSKDVKQQSNRNKGGVAQQNLSLSQLKGYLISLPPFVEQQRIVAKLDAAFAEIETANKAIKRKRENYQTLKSAILAKELQSVAV